MMRREEFLRQCAVLVARADVKLEEGSRRTRLPTRSDLGFAYRGSDDE